MHETSAPTLKTDFCIKTKCLLTLQWVGFLRLNNRLVGERGVLDPHPVIILAIFISKTNLKKVQSILYTIIKKKKSNVSSYANVSNFPRDVLKISGIL